MCLQNYPRNLSSSTCASALRDLPYRTVDNEHTNNMDRPVRRSKRRRLLPLLIGVSIVIAAALYGRRLAARPRALSVDRATIVTDVVRAGRMVVQVRGSGSLVAEDARWLTARTAGRVERVVVDSGGAVQPGAEILELSNPEVDQRAVESSLALRAAVAEARTVSEQWTSQMLTQQAETAAAAAAHEEARLRATADRELARAGLLSPINLSIAEGSERQLLTRLEVARAKLASAERMRDATALQQRVRLEQLRTLEALRRDEAAGLAVRSPLAGVVLRVAVENGQQVAAGTPLALVADPRRLVARLLVPETEAKDIRIGQRATVDARVGTAAGVVARVDSAAAGGNVAVDIRLTGPLPAGARPDLNVDGTIEVADIDAAVHTGRPAVAPAGKASVFRLTTDGTAAVRTTVTFGRISATRVEILEGLAPGEVIVTSDISEWDGFDRIRFK